MSTPSLDPLANLTPEQRKKYLELVNKLEIKGILQEGGILKQPCDEELDKFISVSPIIEQLKKDIRKVWSRQEPVLILGETGTGKELIAKALHGSRVGKFKTVNITNLSNELIESELFGHLKGSFTGALESKEGFFEASKKGTIFLDEIGDMPLNAQAKLLRVLQYKVVRRVGDVNEMEVVDVRVVAATHHNLKEMVEKGTFREDLYWRLRPIVLEVPPIRNRGSQDVYEILDAMFDPEGKIPGEVRDRWCNLNLKGNIRELEARALSYILFTKEIE